MRTKGIVAFLVLGLTLLWSMPASSAPQIGTTDGWYKWQVEGTTTTLFLHQQQGKPTRIQLFSPDCHFFARNIEGDATDMGVLSTDDSVAFLLDIAAEKNLDMDVRQQALFGLAQSDSDTAYAYLDQLIFND